MRTVTVPKFVTFQGREYEWVVHYHTRNMAEAQRYRIKSKHKSLLCIIRKFNVQTVPQGRLSTVYALYARQKTV